MIRGIHHVAITTPDIDRLIAFYRDAIGMEVMRESGWQAGSERIDTLVGLTGSSARTATLRLGNAYLELFEYATPAGRPADLDRPVNDAGYTHFCLDVVGRAPTSTCLGPLQVTYHVVFANYLRPLLK